MPDFSINYLLTLRPEARLAYVREHEAVLPTLTPRQLDQVGTLLCHASDDDLRKERPIEQDLRSNSPSGRAQATFEKYAPTVGAEAAREIALGRISNGNHP